jgi:hypothetical protein
MHVPQTTLVSNIVPVSGGVDVTLHNLVGLSWEILIPYTILGLGLMAYGQIRLARGERMLNGQQRPKNARKKPGKQRQSLIPQFMKLARS